MEGVEVEPVVLLLPEEVAKGIAEVALVSDLPDPSWLKARTGPEGVLDSDFNYPNTVSDHLPVTAEQQMGVGVSDAEAEQAAP